MQIQKWAKIDDEVWDEFSCWYRKHFDHYPNDRAKIELFVYWLLRVEKWQKAVIQPVKQPSSKSIQP